MAKNKKIGVVSEAKIVSSKKTQTVSGNLSKMEHIGQFTKSEKLSQPVLEGHLNKTMEQQLSLDKELEMIKDDMEKAMEEQLEAEKKKVMAEQLKAMVVNQLLAEKEENTSESGSVIYENLSIPSFSMVHIENFRLEQKLNEHICLTFSALLDNQQNEQDTTKDSKKNNKKDNDNVVYYTQVGCQVEVYYTLKGFTKKKKMFQGVVTDVRVRTEGDISRLYVIAHSNTIQLDALKGSCSFQDTGMSYQAVVEEVLKRNKGSKAIYDSAASNAIKNFTMQYKETDWEFIKRMAGQNYLPLVPSYTAEKPCFYFGCQFGEHTYKMHVKEYTVSKNIHQYQTESENYITGVLEKDYITYTVKAYDILKLGDKVEFQGIEFYIIDAVYEMEEGIVFGTYQLGRKKHFRQRKYYNSPISGISLNGSVTDVNRDKVKVHLAIDQKESSAKYWFPYSTMSASPDGSGWYCMPKKGDQVRVYFPDEEEKNCYAISSISSYTPETGSSDKMSDPNVRYLRTPDGMEIKLAPEGITIDAYDGKAVINMDKQGNITINASKNLSITAKEDVTITAEKNVTMYASEEISMTGADGTIVMEKSGNTKVTGEYVLEN